MSGDFCHKHQRDCGGDVVCWECALEWKAELKKAEELIETKRQKIIDLSQALIEAQAEVEQLKKLEHACDIANASAERNRARAEKAEARVAALESVLLDAGKALGWARDEAKGRLPEWWVNIVVAVERVVLPKEKP